MTIKQWLIDATRALVDAGVPSARLDASLLLSDELQRNKAWLLAHDDELISAAHHTNLETALQRRTAREPMAYIRGYKEFYGRNFRVTPDVLIPRPETEAIIDNVLTLPLRPEAVIADIGTGSGAIAITVARERSSYTIIATDVSDAALGIARTNAAALDRRIHFKLGSLLEPLVEPVDVIIANLPYVDRAWERDSPETDHEPALALFADNHGLELIYRLLDQTPGKLCEGGFILLEADPEQHATIVQYAETKNLRHVRNEGYIVVLAV